MDSDDSQGRAWHCHPSKMQEGAGVEAGAPGDAVPGALVPFQQTLVAGFVYSNVSGSQMRTGWQQPLIHPSVLHSRPQK